MSTVITARTQNSSAPTTTSRKKTHPRCAKELPTAEQVRALLDYNPLTGEFRWRETGRGRQVHRAAGGVNGAGYWQIGINGVHYLAHRLAWLHHYGEWPEHTIDHIDRDRSVYGNRIANLRDVTHSVNTANRSAYGIVKFVGVHISKRTRKFVAQYDLGGRVHLGTFSTAEEAARAYDRHAGLHGGPDARTNVSEGLLLPLAGDLH